MSIFTLGDGSEVELGLSDRIHIHVGVKLGDNCTTQPLYRWIEKYGRNHVRKSLEFGFAELVTRERPACDASNRINTILGRPRRFTEKSLQQGRRNQ